MHIECHRIKSSPCLTFLRNADNYSIRDELWKVPPSFKVIQWSWPTCISFRWICITIWRPHYKSNPRGMKSWNPRVCRSRSVESAASDQTSAWDHTRHVQLWRTLKAARITSPTRHVYSNSVLHLKTDLLVFSKGLSQSCFRFVI